MCGAGLEGWRVHWPGSQLGSLGFLARAADMTQLATGETTDRLRRKKDTVVDTREGEINVVRECNVGLDEDLNMATKRHDMGE